MMSDSPNPEDSTTTNTIIPSLAQRAKELRELADLLEDPNTGPHFSALVWGVALNLPAVFQPQAMFLSEEGSASRLALQEGDPAQVRLIVKALHQQVEDLLPREEYSLAGEGSEAGVLMRIGSSTESLGDRDAMAALREFVQLLSMVHGLVGVEG